MKSLVCLILAALLVACDKSTPATTVPPKTPTLRLYFLGGVAGAIEPCGCVKDMLGGVDHAAAMIARESRDAPSTLLLSAGPLLFRDPKNEGPSSTQELWKAEALADAMRTLGLAAWAPGLNDWAAGAGELGRLSERTGATLVAANLQGGARARPTRVVEVAGFKVGIAGVSLPEEGGIPAPAVAAGDPRKALADALRSLDGIGARLRIALVAAPRGQALRLAEAVPGFQIMVIGKPFDRGDANDAPTPPVRVGKTLVVEPTNHLQSVAVVDLFVRDDSFEFADGSGIEAAERRTSLEQRVHDLELRIAEAQRPDAGASARDVLARRTDLTRYQGELASLDRPKIPERGSFFLYRLDPVRDSAGKEPNVATHIDDFYRRVNDHNREVFKDLLPPPVPEGKAGYGGADSCSDCHDEERDFWNKTPHAKAYDTLVKEHKEFNLDCVGCHVTGYQKPGGSTVTHVKNLEDVQCEVCHGPGTLHNDDSENPALFPPIPDEKLCASQCHRPPHVKADWDVKEAWTHIVGKGHQRKPKPDGGAPAAGAKPKEKIKPGHAAH